MERSFRISLALLVVFMSMVAQAGFAAGSMHGCQAAEDWRSAVEATVREGKDVEKLSLALTSRPGCSQVATRSSYLCSWTIEERLFDDAVLVGVASATIVCVADSAGMIAQQSPAREWDGVVSTCSIRFGFMPDAAGPCGPGDD